MPSDRQNFGKAAEDRAAGFLRQKGYTIIDRHVTSRYGEIDILAKDGNTIVAVEVKARNGSTYGTAIEAMTNAKIKKIAAALHDILEKRSWMHKEYRIDVVTIDQDRIFLLQSIGPE